MEKRNERPTILHLTTSLDTGGMERQLQFSLERLPQYSHVVVCLKRWGPIGNVLRDVMGVPTYHIPTTFPWRISSWRAFAEIARTFRPQLIITYLPLADLCGRIWGRRAHVPKIACFLHSTLREPRYLPFILLNNLTQHLVDRFFAVSRSVQENYERWGLRSGVTEVIPNGIVIRHHEVPASFGHNLRSSLKVEEGVPLAGYVGRLRKERGHQFLVQVAQELKKRGIRIRFLFIGDGDYQRHVEQTV